MTKRNEHGIVEKLQVEADEDESANRDFRMRRAERLGLPYDSRDSAFLDRYEAEANWLDQYGSS